MSTLRISLRLFVGLVATACAHVEPPRGGPEDRIPPTISATTPAPDSIVPGHEGPVVFELDERISQEGIEDAVSVSPRTSPVQVRHGRDNIRVSLREGWQAGIVYHVTLQRSVRDLFGNALTAPFRLVFSTGPAIPATQVTGAVVDRLTGQPSVDARVEAIRTADSLTYSVQSDSVGRFVLDRFPEGDYQIRAFPDINRNRSLDGFESSDSVLITVALTDTVDVALQILPRDSTPPVAASVTVDSLQLQVEFDDYLELRSLLASQVSLIHPTVGEMEVATVTLATPAPPTEAPLPTPAAAPLPSRELLVDLPAGTQLQPDVEYRLMVRGIENVNGLIGDSEVTFEVPAPPLP